MNVMVILITVTECCTGASGDLKQNGQDFATISGHVRFGLDGDFTPMGSQLAHYHFLKEAREPWRDRWLSCWRNAWESCLPTPMPIRHNYILNGQDGDNCLYTIMGQERSTLAFCMACSSHPFLQQCKETRKKTK